MDNYINIKEDKPKKRKNRPFFENGYKKNFKKNMKRVYYIKHDDKIQKLQFHFGKFIVEFK